MSTPSSRPLRDGVKVSGWSVLFPRPLWERVEFVSELCELRNSGEGLNYSFKLYPPTPFGYCLGFAPRSQNLTFGAELLSVRFARYPDYLTNVRVVRPQIRFPRKGGRARCVHLAPTFLDHLITWSLDHCPQKEVLL